MRFIVLVLTAMLWASSLYAQSVPNGGAITPGQVWTPAQWTTAWQSKLDINNGILNGTTLNNPTINGATFLGNQNFTSLSLAGTLNVTGTSTLSSNTTVAGSLTAAFGNVNPVVLSNGGVSMTNGFTFNLGSNQSLIVNSGGNGTAFTVTGLGTAIANRLQTAPASTGNAPSLSVTGSDASIDLALSPKNVANGKTGAINLGGRLFSTRPTITWSGGVVATNAAFWDTGAWTGTSSGGGFLYNITTTDTVQSNATPITVLNVNHQVGGGNSAGGRNAITAQMWQSGATIDQSLGIDPFYTGVNGLGIMSHTIGTGLTPGTAKGHAFGMNPVGRLSGTPQNAWEVSAAEFDVEADSGSTFLRKDGAQIVLQNTAANGSFGVDTGLMFGTSMPNASTYGWDIGIGFGSQLSGGFDIKSTGTLIKTPIGNSTTGAQVPLVAHGIDLLELSATSDVFRSRGFSVDGSGNVQVGTAYLTSGPTGLALDVKGNVGTGTPTIAAGGTGYVLNDPIYFQGNGIASVSGVSGGVVTAVTIIQQPYISTSTPANPVATTTWPLSPGTGLTLNVSWNTTATTLSLNPGGGAVQFGSGTFTANGSVATALSSLGPVGSHTTVQEWLTIKDAGGTVRYIPAF